MYLAGCVIYICHARKYLANILVPITELRTTDLQTSPVAIQAVFVLFHVVVQYSYILKRFGNVQVVGPKNRLLCFKCLLKTFQGGLVFTPFSVNFAYPAPSIRHALVFFTEA